MKGKRPLAEVNSLGGTMSSQENGRLNMTEGRPHLPDSSCLATLLKHWTEAGARDESPISARLRKPPLGLPKPCDKEDKVRSQTPSNRPEPVPDFGSAALFKGSLDTYSIGRQIGQGAYASVKLGLDKTSSHKVAIKIYDKVKMMDPHRRRNVRREIEVMAQLQHSNCVRLIEAINTSKQICLVMEYVQGGSLHGYLKQRALRRLEEAEARRVFVQIVTGLQYCHAKSIAHRDIKLENVLLDENREVKIIDFGFSTQTVAGQRSRMFCGTPSYMAPEIVARKEYSAAQADIWALGVLLFALLAGSFPFKGITDKDLYSKIQRGLFDLPVSIPPLARALIQKMLTIEPSRRPACSDILKHAWITSESQAKEAEEPAKHECSSSLVAALFEKYHYQRKPHAALCGHSARTWSRPHEGKEN